MSASSTSAPSTPTVNRDEATYAKIRQAYEEAGLQYEKDTEDIIEMNWRATTEDKNRPASPTEKRINSIYRVKVGGKEYLLYFVTEYRTDFLGNRHDWTHLVGKYKHPIFSQRYSQAEGRPVASGLLDTEMRYEIPYTGPESVDAILAIGTIPYDTKFYVDTGYSCFANYSLEEFRSRSFFELEQKGITGKYPRPEEVERQKQKDLQDQARTQWNNNSIITTRTTTTTVQQPSVAASTIPKTLVTNPVELGIPADLAADPTIAKNIEGPRVQTAAVVPPQIQKENTEILQKEIEAEAEEEAERIQRQQRQQLETKRRVSRSRRQPPQPSSTTTAAK